MDTEAFERSTRERDAAMYDSMPHGSTRRLRQGQTPERKKDRIPALRYRQAPRVGLPDAARRRLVPVETFTLGHDLFLSEVLFDSADSLSLPPCERHGLIRLGAMSTGLGPLAGGVLIDSREALGNDLAQAVVLHFLSRHKVTVRLGTVFGGPVRDISDLCFDLLGQLKQSVGESTFSEELDDFDEACRDLLVARRDTLHLLGDGPLRDAQAAGSVARDLKAEHWTNAEIAQYLALYGFKNASRTTTIGRWNHDRLREVIDER